MANLIYFLLLTQIQDTFLCRFKFIHFDNKYQKHLGSSLIIFNHTHNQVLSMSYFEMPTEKCSLSSALRSGHANMEALKSLIISV